MQRQGGDIETRSDTDTVMAPVDRFACGDGTYVDMAAFADGAYDCPNGADELTTMPVDPVLETKSSGKSGG